MSLLELFCDVDDSWLCFAPQWRASQLAAGKQREHVGQLCPSEVMTILIVAVGHSILLIYYHILITSEPYREKGEDNFPELDRKHAARRLTKQLEHLGYLATLTPAQMA
jgi:hypothetical protein